MSESGRRLWTRDRATILTNKMVSNCGREAWARLIDLADVRTVAGCSSQQMANERDPQEKTGRFCRTFRPIVIGSENLTPERIPARTTRSRMMTAFRQFEKRVAILRGKVCECEVRRRCFRALLRLAEGQGQREVTEFSFGTLPWTNYAGRQR